MLDDRLAERLALTRIAHRRLERAARDTDRLRRDADPATVERQHREREAAARRTEHRIVPHLDVVEHELRRRRRCKPSLSSSRATTSPGGDAALPGPHDERRDALVPARRGSVTAHTMITPA